MANTMKDRLLFISGCSHAAGSEIDGQEDSIYNRQHSFGNLLAEKLGRRAINAASAGCSNWSISRTILEWMQNEYNPNTMDVMVLCAWTDSLRMEVPWHETKPWAQCSPAANYRAHSNNEYIRFNIGYAGGDEEEIEQAKYYNMFMTRAQNLLEITSVNLVLQIQWYLKCLNIPYIMCNTMDLFQHHTKPIDFYLNQIDNQYFYKMVEKDASFYWKYRNAGYNNPLAKWWHHNEIPHQLYADELYEFYQNQIEKSHKPENLQ